MAPYVIDMRSDTVSLPTPEMRQAMAEAILGDDVYGEDPTVKQLETRMAQLCGKQAGLFVPSGTMGNLISVMVHCDRRGSEAIVGDLSHVYLYEQGGSAHIAGVQLATIRNNVDGTFDLQELRHKIRYEDCHEPITQLVVVENTHNMCGGKVIPLKWLDELAAMLKEPGISPAPIRLHMDGARILNAAAAMNVPVERIVRDFDSVNICLSKTLSAPVGSVLVGSKAFIAQAHRLRKALGGGMRQVGVLAAAGLVALETIVPCLNVYNERTKRIAAAIAKLKSSIITVDFDNVQTNILLLQVTSPKLTASEFAERLAKITPEELAAGITMTGSTVSAGIVIKASARDWQYARIVLYHQISDKDVELAIQKFEFVIREYDRLLA